MRSGPGFSVRAPVEPPRLQADLDVTVDAVVVAVGLIEAVDVRDGHFTPVLRCDESPGLIALEFADRLKKRVMQHLCRRVVVDGRLYVADANGYRLEVRSLRALPPGRTPPQLAAAAPSNVAAAAFASAAASLPPLCAATIEAS